MNMMNMMNDIHRICWACGRGAVVYIAFVRCFVYSYGTSVWANMCGVLSLGEVV